MLKGPTVKQPNSNNKVNISPSEFYLMCLQFLHSWVGAHLQEVTRIKSISCKQDDDWAHKCKQSDEIQMTD